MTRLLFVGDLHGDLTAACQAVDAAVEHDADVIMQAGDFGIWTHTTLGVQYLEELQRYLDKHGQVLYFVDGNHENFDHLYDIPLGPNGLRKVKDRIIHIPRGKVIHFGETSLMGFGGANSIDGPNGADWWGQARGPAPAREVYSMARVFNGEVPEHVDLGNWWQQEEITQEQVDSIDEAPVDILLTHECPEGVYIPGIDKSYHAGRRQRYLMGEVVKKVRPKLLVHGHYHRRYTSSLNDTKIIGLGYNMGSLNDMLHLVDTEEINGNL